MTLNTKMNEALLIESIKKEDVFERREIKAEYYEYEDIVVPDFIAKLSSLHDDIGSVTNILDDIEDVPESSVTEMERLASLLEESFLKLKLKFNWKIANLNRIKRIKEKKTSDDFEDQQAKQDEERTKSDSNNAANNNDDNKIKKEKTPMLAEDRRQHHKDRKKRKHRTKTLNSFKYPVENWQNLCTQRQDSGSNWLQPSSNNSSTISPWSPWNQPIYPSKINSIVSSTLSPWSPWNQPSWS